MHWAKSKPDIEFEKSAFMALFYCLKFTLHTNKVCQTALYRRYPTSGQYLASVTSPATRLSENVFSLIYNIQRNLNSVKVFNIR
ncbi:hypothetical protein RJ43_09390 [Alteromonas macleodii]|uniref:Transposase n=1 Tax=Alteromonas macleodii TaxID=28108 RepID=A0AB36FTX7_ALTMA|nr:hypothetical protein RJ43_09390 [Alteromonas macleodii]OES26910.1 hypothetical protein BFV95_3750 [Alteromonas macleodii]OES27564.1 hypothetical protein BFV94_3745 [Alteromonas macleodii]OES27776.1 hypothetical protein BFV93_3740 [Alteromonas macleodii]OES39632.1 hypothetical protein BFV96_3734 [Alteromonas macleodii]